MYHKHFEPNSIGTDYIIGDIHGCYATYLNAFEKLNFDVTKDRMFSVGDLVDRGESSLTCVLELLKLPYFHSVRGNHEQMAIDYIDLMHKFEHRNDYQTYSANGGDWFLDLHIDLQKLIADKFRELPLVITIGDVAIMHADPVYSNFENVLKDLEELRGWHLEQLKESIMWNRRYVYFNADVFIENINKIFLGHTPQVAGPKTIGNMHFIDTGSVFGHVLTICKLDGTIAVVEPNIDKRYKSKQFR